MPAPANAQGTEQGLHYFAVENRDVARVEQRGKAGSAGTAFQSLILAPGTNYRVWILQAQTLRVGRVDVRSPANGQSFTFPDIVLRAPTSGDTDGDGLSDQGEFILGTDPRTVDTDGDGVNDGPEVVQARDPLDGHPGRVGLLASVDTPGTAMDVCAGGDLAVVADGDRGISVFNVFNGLEPRLVAQVETPGLASRVACSAPWIAVNDGTGGLVVVNAAAPGTTQIVHRLSPPMLGGEPRAIVAEGGIAYVGLTNGKIVSIDLASGTMLDSTITGQAVQDMVLSGDALFALSATSLQTLPTGCGPLRVTSAVPLNGTPVRLALGSGRVYTVHGGGFHTYDVRDLAAPPIRIASSTSVDSPWKQLAVSGPGVAVALTGTDASASLYDVGVVPEQFITRFSIPQSPLAVTTYNGLAYIADGGAGLQVLNYLAFDSAGLPPTVALAFSFDPAAVEEGKRVRVTADAQDDVQVRSVEFYVDGARIASDGTYPFEHRFTTPRRGAQPTFRVRARAFDTGGNLRWSNEVTATLTTDVTPPVVHAFGPPGGAARAHVGAVAAFFSEPIDPASLTGSVIAVAGAGTDGALGTADDVPIAGGVASVRDEVLGAFLTFATPLSQGRYRARVEGTIADRAGNLLGSARTWDFRVYGSGQDADGDGIPDEVETLLGLNPGNVDSDGDGILDGDEDLDADGLKNLAEVVLGYDPLDNDSDNDGVTDGNKDTDGDGLTDGAELIQGTSATDGDSDRDGFIDGEEVTAGTDPRDPRIIPLRTAIATCSIAAVPPSPTTAITAISVAASPAPPRTAITAISVAASPAPPRTAITTISVAASETAPRTAITTISVKNEP